MRALILLFNAALGLSQEQRSEAALTRLNALAGLIQLAPDGQRMITPLWLSSRTDPAAEKAAEDHEWALASVQ